MYTDTSKLTFIPKAPVTTIQQPTSISGTVSSEKVSQGIGFMGWMGVLVLIATVVATGGLVLYVGYFQSQRTAVIEGLKRKQESVDTKFIADAQKLSARIGFAKELLARQVYATPFFQELHEKTLASIQYDGFELKEKQSTPDSAGTAVSQQYQAVLSGKARSYEVIAQQSDVYGGSRALATHFFSDFKVDSEKNLINFVLTVDIPDKLGHDRFAAPLEPSQVPEDLESVDSAPATTDVSLDPVPTNDQFPESNDSLVVPVVPTQ